MDKLLNNLTKAQLIDFINELINNNDLSVDTVKNYLCSKDLTAQEIDILEKLKNFILLNEQDKQYIQSILDKRRNTKVNSLLHGQDKFIKSLVETKIQKFFSLSWNVYPKKVGKSVGYKAFVKLVKDFKLKDLDTNCLYIIKKIKQYKQICEEEQKEEQYIMHFSTFCNSKKYL